MLSLRRLIDRIADRRPRLRPSRHSFRKPWWRRTSRVWLLMVMLALMIAAIVVLLRSAPAGAWMPSGSPGTELPDSQ